MLSNAPPCALLCAPIFLTDDRGIDTVIGISCEEVHEKYMHTWIAQYCTLICRTVTYFICSSGADYEGKIVVFMWTELYRENA